MPLEDDDADCGFPPSPSPENEEELLSNHIAPEEQIYITKSQAYNLYTSHFLSTWNIRTYEFAAIIFTQAAYPNTLRPAAIRGIVRTFASICFTSLVGRWVDKSPNRLKTLISTISVNRISVITASILWFFIVEPSHVLSSSNPDHINIPFPDLLKAGIFALILILGIAETLSGQGNMLSMERDWIVTVAAPAGREYDLTHLNAVTRRIDLVCKLTAPILISVVISWVGNRMGVLAVGGMSLVCWFIEIFCARKVYHNNPALQARKHTSPSSSPLPNANNLTLESLKQGLTSYARQFSAYFSTHLCIPSLSLALLYFSALAYSANFITFMINAGISLEVITIARAAGSVVEIGSTVVTPFGVRVLGNAVNHGRLRGRGDMDGRRALMGARLGEGDEMGEGDDVRNWKAETGCERLGLWGLVWMLVNLIPVVLTLFYLSPSQSTSLPATTISSSLPASLPLLTLTLFTTLSLSRLGLWIFDLTTQQLTQTLIPSNTQASFTSIEYVFSSLFELLQNIAAMVYAKPEEFKYLGLMSFAAVGVSTVLYAGWVWWVRGHLVHWERVGGCCEKRRLWDRIDDDDLEGEGD